MCMLMLFKGSREDVSVASNLKNNFFLGQTLLQKSK